MNSNYYIIEDICALLGAHKGKAVAKKTVYTYINKGINKGILPKPETDKHLGRNVWLKSVVNECPIVKKSILIN